MIPIGDVAASAALEWVGTPFFPRMAKKHVGADCIQLVLAIYQEVGLVPPGVEIPRYHLSQGKHLDRNVIGDWLAGPGAEWMTELPADARDPKPGDLLLFQVGRVVYHAAVTVYHGRFVHALRGYGVMESFLRDETWSTKLRAVYRPKEIVE